MPIPEKNENKQDFVKRCIPIVLKEGTAKDNDQAIAICNSMWEQEKTEMAIWTKAYINDLPDDAFAYIEPSGKKDDQGKTVPRILRHLPYKDAEGNIDLPHLRNALARLSQTKLSPEIQTQVKKKLQSIAKKEGIGQTKMQIEYTDVKEKNILYSGNFGKGKQITDEMIDDMIVNFNNGVLSPYLNLDHDESFTDKIKDALKVVRLGTVSKLYKKGKKLFADFKNVPKKIAELIENGALGQRSIEMFKKIKRADKTYNHVLSAVSFFGKGIPAVPNLEDHIPSLYVHDVTEEPIKIILEQEDIMETIQISKEEYDQLKSSMSEFETFKADKANGELVKLKDENSQLKSQVDELIPFKNKAEQLQKQIEAQEEDYLAKEAEDFCEKFKDRIPPAYKVDYINDYRQYYKNDKERLERFKKEISERKQTLFENLTYPDRNEFTGKVDFTDEESIENAIQHKIRSKGLKWAEARKEVFAVREV